MATRSKAIKRIRASAPFLAVGALLAVVAYRITPSIGDRSIPLSEWRLQHRLGSAVWTFADVFLVIGALLLWFSIRSAFRERGAHPIQAGDPLSHAADAAQSRIAVRQTTSSDD